MANIIRFILNNDKNNCNIERFKYACMFWKYADKCVVWLAKILNWVELICAKLVLPNLYVNMNDNNLR